EQMSLVEPRLELKVCNTTYNKKAPFRGRVTRRNGAQISGRNACSDGFLQFLGGAEGNLFRSLDVNGLAGGGVAAHARSALAHLQDAEADDADPLALLEVLGDPGDHVVEDGLGLLLGQLLLVGDRRREVFERNGGWGSCLLRHVWPSSVVIMA